MAVKIAAFNRYQTIDVVRALAEVGRGDIALYTGNDDNIVADLVTPYRFEVEGKQVERRMVGGLLGHWAVWTRSAVELHAACRRAGAANAVPAELLATNIEVTDMNAALFDVAHQLPAASPACTRFSAGRGCLQALVPRPKRDAQPRQSEELDRVSRTYPYLTDDDFVGEHLGEWLG